jgi:hypothetical protein
VELIWAVERAGPLLILNWLSNLCERSTTSLGDLISLLG